ncbi:hypothetical protein [Halomarina pelagica]|uniref:hypothetical protein n=1 Tax=Halomarina pelagica TaxID=2961599 RepID=UPI0020C299AF|nr:hypothetical protein [Halomarina sp. BND7]
MGTFEKIAVLDMKLRVVVVVAVLTFLVVAIPILTVFSLDAGVVTGAVAAIVAAYLTAKRLS